MNQAQAPIRGLIERAFGTPEHCNGWRRVRSCGLPRNGAHLRLLCTAMNVRCAERLLAWRTKYARNPTFGHGNREPGPRYVCA